MNNTLIKQAMIRLKQFKQLKNIKLPWYRRRLARQLAPNDKNIQDALREAMPGASGRLARALRDLQ